MIEIATPIQFHQVVTSGRTKPSRLTCERADQSRVEVVAKFSGSCERREAALSMEVIGAYLASDLGLPVPVPYLLCVEQDWIATVPDAERRATMLQSSRVAFGSTQVGSGYRVWTSADQVAQATLPAAVGTFVFDAFINNVDRRLDNPNCLVKGAEIRIFDHELAFLYNGILGWQPPWEIGSLAAFTTPGQHIFYQVLKGRELDLEPVKQAWLTLDDGRLAAYKASLPAAWMTAEAAVDDAIGLIKGARNNIDAALVEVRRVLS